eukprot:TRINITY_DN4645_c0_g1_i1.p1 TRINITY_DN4645_c0_g1~~TRINITY_DN4645_c0_g1_i1.p1  ORF type:complete len:264 (+),score=102.72 TRINITY_DN4645_c0_g1_i1:151-942(+)
MMQENQFFSFEETPSLSLNEQDLLEEFFLENLLKNEPSSEDNNNNNHNHCWLEEFGLTTSGTSLSPTPSSSPVSINSSYVFQPTTVFDFLNYQPSAVETNHAFSTEESCQETPFSPAVSSSLPSSPLPSSPTEPYHSHVEAKTNKKMKRNQLSSWICTQRQDRKSGELPEYRIKLLDLVGFVWSKQHKQQMQHSSQPVPSSPNRKNSLDNVESMEQDILSNSSISLLSGRAQRNHDQWMMRYKELMQFKKKYGHLKVPTLIPA